MGTRDDKGWQRQYDAPLVFPDKFAMELRQLRYFVAVADTRSISAAARKLHVVQSAVSHQIANLESELGVELLLRGKSGVTLTTAGQFLYRHALAIAKHVETATHEVKRIDKEIRGKVALGLPNSTAEVLALPLLEAVRSELPYVQLTIVEGLSGLLAEQLGSGRIDLSVLFDTEPVRGFQQTPLLAERLHFVSANPEMLRRRRSARGIPLQDVLARPLILPPQPNGTRVLLEREALRLGMRPIVVADVTGVATMLAAVRAGVADTVMMAVNARDGRNDGLLVEPVRAPVIERHAALFAPSQYALPAATTCVRDILLRIVRDLMASGGWPGARPLAFA